MFDDLKAQLGSSVRNAWRFLERPIELDQGNVTLGEPKSQTLERARKERQEKVRQMRSDLLALMQKHRGTRLLMAHLNLVECTLRQRGLSAVERLPAPVLAKALHQLENLVWDWSPAGLAELRSRLSIQVRQRRAELSASRRAAMDLADASLSAPQVIDLLDVDHAMFEDMERSWAGQMPKGDSGTPAQAS